MAGAHPLAPNPSETRAFEPIATVLPYTAKPLACHQLGEPSLIHYQPPGCHLAVDLCAFPQFCDTDRANQLQTCKSEPGGACTDYEGCRARNPSGQQPSVAIPELHLPGGSSVDPQSKVTTVFYSQTERLLHLDPSQYVPGCQAKPLDVCYGKTRLSKIGDDGDAVSLGEGGPAGCPAIQQDGKTGCPTIVACADPKGPIHVTKPNLPKPVKGPGAAPKGGAPVSGGAIVP